MNPAEMEAQLMGAFLDWEGLLVNPRFCRDGGRVAWSNYDVGIIRDPINREKVLSLVETKQYTFQCAEDGSIFQILYEYDDGANLRRARLAFYKIAHQLEEDDPDEDLVSEASEGIFPWIRFDFTRDYASGVLHHNSHLHLGGFRDARLVVAGVPGPRQFVELVVAMCYPEYYKVHRLNDNGDMRDNKAMAAINVCCRGPFGGDVECSLIHVKVP